MAYAHVAPAQGPIRYIIVHNNGKVTTALTIDCSSKQNLNLVYGEISMDDKRGLIESIDETKDKSFHDALHADMQAAMNTNLMGTFTDYHQHWVDKNKKQLSNGELMLLLDKFKKKTWISKI